MKPNLQRLFVQMNQKQNTSWKKTNLKCEDCEYPIKGELYLMLHSAKEGGWKYHNRYKGLDCLTSFLNRQQSYRCNLTVIASWQAYQAIAASWHLYFCCILRKEVQQSSHLYLIWHFQPPPYIVQNCFSYFLSMQYTNRGHLAVIALSDRHKAMAARLNH